MTTEPHTDSDRIATKERLHNLIADGRTGLQHDAISLDAHHKRNWRTDVAMCVVADTVRQALGQMAEYTTPWWGSMEDFPLPEIHHLSSEHKQVVFDMLDLFLKRRQELFQEY